MNKDTIYREDAIKAINLQVRIPHDVASAQYASMAINAIRSVSSADGPQSICEYGRYCMCATCHYQEDCSYCADCTGVQKQMHDVWTCTKYMRKEHLRKGADNE